MAKRLFTSESVTDGHPDKIADQISDAVLDAVLAEDPRARVACETLVTTGLALLAGEITTRARVDFAKLVRETLRGIGYKRAEYGIDAKTCAVLQSIDSQSPEIGAGVDRGGAGDQGLMFGYACDETDALMPAPITYAHALARRLSEVRRSGELSWLRPDGKSQVTFEYDGSRPVRVKTVVLSAQHADGKMREEIHEELMARVVRQALPADYFDPDDACCLINPSGRFVQGGPHGDAGMTGRKIIVDTYGGTARHGGGAFSGKDATKVDRSGAYAARWAAKNLVAAGVASRCEVQLAYAIGQRDPVQVFVDSFGTSEFGDERLSEAVREVFDFTPQGMIRALDLDKPVFRDTAAFGHFGREPRAAVVGGCCVRFFAWEETNRVDELRAALGA